MAANEIIGRGWEFPPIFSKSEGGVRLISDVEEIEGSIYIILHTAIGERVMRRNFGSNLHELMFEPLTENIKTYMATSLRESLEVNEPRIAVKSLKLEQKDPQLGRIDILVEITILQTRQALSLVIPYEIPELP